MQRNVENVRMEVRATVEWLRAHYPGLEDDDAIYLMARFFGKITLPNGGKNRCWIWCGARDKKGYGLFRITQQEVARAHRLCYEIFNGDAGDDLVVCHKCDNPSCVNPKHLFLGTHNDNVQDCIKKDRRRYVSGPRHHSWKLSEVDKLAICQRFASGEPATSLAAEFGVSKTTIHRHVSNWRSRNDRRS